MAAPRSLRAGSAYHGTPPPSPELSSLLYLELFLSPPPLLCYLPGHKIGFLLPRGNNYVNAHTFGSSGREKSTPIMCQILSQTISFSLRNKLRS